MCLRNFYKEIFGIILKNVDKLLLQYLSKFVVRLSDLTYNDFLKVYQTHKLINL